MSDRAPGAGVRAAAARAVARVVDGGRSLPAQLEDPAITEDRDKALLSALVNGALRWHHRLNWLVGRLADRPPGKGESQLAALIRIGLFQLEHLRVPDHAAVSATVAAARLIRRRHASGLVNAVLRRYLREREALALQMHADPEARYSHPAWLIEHLQRELPDSFERVLDAGNEEPPMWLRVNARHGSAEDYRQRLAGRGIEASGDLRLPTALCLARPCPAAELPGFAEGHVSIQDAGAQIAAGLVDVQPGERVLDACAAPGGKTAHMLEGCPGIGTMVALDRSAERLAEVGKMLGRLGLSAQLLAADAAEPASWWDGKAFDKILLDAPCSALGVIRRHPDIKLLRRPADIEKSRQEQARLLDTLWPLLAPGGRLVYATCTLAQAENSGQIQAFIERTGDARLTGGDNSGEIKRFPGEANTDGFYYASLAKQNRR